MRWTSMKLNTLHDLFVEEVKNLYCAEQQISQALPKMIDAASNPDLKDRFQQQMNQTQQQMGQLEDIFDMLDVEPEEGTCEGIQAILKEAQGIMSAEGSPAVRDAALILAAQKVEHYLLASYGTVRSFAQSLVYSDIAQKLQTTLNREKDTDKMLTQVAMSDVNPSAVR